MERRDFLRLTGLASATLAAPAATRALAAEGADAPWRTFEVTTRVEVLDAKGPTRVWVPVPLLEERSFLKPMGNSFDAIDGNTRFALDPHYSAGMVCGEWAEGIKRSWHYGSDSAESALNHAGCMSARPSSSQ